MSTLEWKYPCYNHAKGHTVPEDAFENVELVVEPPAINRVEDLGKDEGVEHKCCDNQVVLFRVVQTKGCVAEEVENEDDDDQLWQGP